MSVTPKLYEIFKVLTMYDIAALYLCYFISLWGVFKMLFISTTSTNFNIVLQSNSSTIAWNLNMELERQGFLNQVDICLFQL